MPPPLGGGGVRVCHKLEHERRRKTSKILLSETGMLKALTFGM